MTGSVFGGTASGFVAYSLCNLAFGAPSFGTSLLWCGVVAGGVGSFAGGKLFGNAGKNVGNLIYEADSRAY